MCSWGEPGRHSTERYGQEDDGRPPSAGEGGRQHRPAAIGQAVERAARSFFRRMGIPGVYKFSPMSGSGAATLGSAGFVAEWVIRDARDVVVSW